MFFYEYYKNKFIPDKEKQLILKELESIPNEAIRKEITLALNNNEFSFEDYCLANNLDKDNEILLFITSYYSYDEYKHILEDNWSKIYYDMVGNPEGAEATKYYGKTKGGGGFHPSNYINIDRVCHKHGCDSCHKQYADMLKPLFRK